MPLAVRQSWQKHYIRKPRQRVRTVGINDEKRVNKKQRCDNNSCDHNTTETSERRRKGPYVMGWGRLRDRPRQLNTATASRRCRARKKLHSGLPQLVSQFGPRGGLLLPRLSGVKKTPRGRAVLADHEQWQARRGEERKDQEGKNYIGIFIKPYGHTRTRRILTQS